MWKCKSNEIKKNGIKQAFDPPYPQCELHANHKPNYENEHKIGMVKHYHLQTDP